jgi:hypothetical protein
MAGPLYFANIGQTSTTKGTGPFVLAGALAGLNPFSTTGMATGDTFYYSAVNIDNPAQVEIGLGTLRADGGIDRACMKSGCTDFSAGTKNIYLISLAPQPVVMISGAVGGGLTNTELRASPLTVTGPITDAQLRATPLPISGNVAVSNFPATQPISGAVSVSNFPGTQPISGNVGVTGSVAVTGTFWQATQPVSGTFWQATQPVSGPLTDVQLRASAVPVSGTFFQATQPVSLAATVNVSVQNASLAVTQSGTWTVTAPTLTKGTQGANGFTVQALKDAGRACICLTAEFTFAQTAETLLTLTKSIDGAATSTGSSFAISNGKKFRVQSISATIESLGSGTGPQRAYVRLRRNNAGATTASSSLQGVWGFINSTAIVKSGFSMDYEFPDGLEMTGDGTATFGVTLETPDWVTTTGTGRIKLTIIGFEY